MKAIVFGAAMAVILGLLTATAAAALPPSPAAPPADGPSTAQVLQRLAETLTPEPPGWGGDPSMPSFRGLPQLEGDSGFCRRPHLVVETDPAAGGAIKTFRTYSGFTALADHPEAASCADLDRPDVVYFAGELGDDYALDGYRLFKRMQAELAGGSFEILCDVAASREECAAELAGLKPTSIEYIAPCWTNSRSAKLDCYSYQYPAAMARITIRVSGEQITEVELEPGYRI